MLPPASAPSVLTVGGLDDRNRLAFGGYGMYHSSYGPTVDGLQKPEVIAPGIWVAAPILPGTPTAAQAELLARLDGVPDEELRAAIAARAGIDRELDAAVGADAVLLRQLVELKLARNNVISGAYKHVDGTSFAAPDRGVHRRADARGQPAPHAGPDQTPAGRHRAPDRRRGAGAPGLRAWWTPPPRFARRVNDFFVGETIVGAPFGAPRPRGCSPFWGGRIDSAGLVEVG